MRWYQRELRSKWQVLCCTAVIRDSFTAGVMLHSVWGGGGKMCLKFIFLALGFVQCQCDATCCLGVKLNY